LTPSNEKRSTLSKRDYLLPSALLNPEPSG
jgi:hypothetical protein